jgi:hypothetical protein
MFCRFGVCLRLSARSAGDIGVSIECSYVNILPQMAQITQTNTASCIISQRKTVCVVPVALGFVCVNLRDLREILGFHLC